MAPPAEEPATPTMPEADGASAPAGNAGAASTPAPDAGVIGGAHVTEYRRAVGTKG